MKDVSSPIIFHQEYSNFELSQSAFVASSSSCSANINSKYSDLAETTFDFLHRSRILAEYLYGHDLVVFSRKCNKILSKKYPFDVHTKYFYHTCILTTEHLIDIAQRGLSRFSYLERLELEKHEDAIPFTLNGFYELGEALMKCSSNLTYLNLSGLFMRSTGLQLIFRGFLQDPEDLNEDHMYDTNIKSICKYSQSKEIGIPLIGKSDFCAHTTNEGISDSGTCAATLSYQNYKHFNFMVSKKLEGTRKKSCYVKTSSLLSLSHLDLAYNDIKDGKSGLRTLAKLLPLCPSLKYLDLGHNFITCLSNESLKAIFYRCKRLEVFDLRGNLLSENGTRTLFLLENMIEEETVEENENYINEEEAKEDLDSALSRQSNDTITEGTYLDDATRYLHIPVLPLPNPLPVKNSIPSTSSIKRLDLTSNQIKNDNFIPFCEQILYTSKFTNLKYIKVSKNFINLDQNINPYYDILKEEITFLT